MIAWFCCLVNRPRWLRVALNLEVCAWCQAEHGSARHPS